jgi:hypothetical protein
LLLLLHRRLFSLDPSRRGALLSACSSDSRCQTCAICTKASDAPQCECYHRPMTSALRALASLIVGLTTVVGMVVYQHYSREPPSDGVTVAVTTAASILAWLVTGLE